MQWLGTAALLLICPIAMIVMMRSTGHGKDRATSDTDPLAGMSTEQLHELTRRAHTEIEQRDAGAASDGG